MISAMRRCLLTVFVKDGKEVESWVSGEKPHYIEKLPAGAAWYLRKKDEKDQD